MIDLSQDAGEGIMNFKSDLKTLFENYFSLKGIRYRGNSDVADLAARYCEMVIRRISPKPRRVHFSNEINGSLRKLTQEADPAQKGKALEAWNTVFKIRHLLVEGGDLTPHLSKSVNDAHSQDGLLWDYGMHHFHLSLTLDASGFVERSDYLLFAILTDEDAFLVDIRKHHDDEGLLWVRQGLLRIVHANWPEITSSRQLHGVRGTTLTDRQKKNLRDKNANTALALGEQAIAPLGWGTTANGSSTWCQAWAAKLLREIENQASYFGSQPEELRSALEAKGVKVSGEMAFQLVRLESVEPSPDLLNALQSEQYFGKGISSMGFIIVEATTGLPIVVTFTDKSELQPRE